MTKDKKFDCVEMMHEGQAKTKERLEGMSVEEKLAYYKKRAEEVRNEQARLQSDSSVTINPS